VSVDYATADGTPTNGLKHPAVIEALAQYKMGNPFSVEKISLESPGDTVTYRSRPHAKISYVEVFTPTDLLTAMTQHVPDKCARMVRFWSLNGAAWTEIPSSG
jgi:hypothetical protein